LGIKAKVLGVALP